MLSPRIMLILAQSILAIGAISLVPAAWKLFHRALDLGLSSWHLWWIIPVSLALGAGKALFVMRKRMRQNIKRIATSPGKLWPWQIYPPQLLAFIVTMAILMKIMKRVLADNALGLGILGGVDLTVAVALVVASAEYLRPRDY